MNGRDQLSEAGEDTLERTQELDAWLIRAGRGEVAAFEEVYNRLAAPVYGVVLRVIRDAALAEEVLQEVMLELWRTADRFDPGRGSARAWCVMIAHRRAVDRVRSEQAHGDRQDRAVRESQPLAHQLDLSELMERRTDEQRLYRCVAELTDLQRESVQLAYFHGLTYRQVAEALDAPLSTVKTRIRDGLGRLRMCLEAC